MSDLVVSVCRRSPQRATIILLGKQGNLRSPSTKTLVSVSLSDRLVQFNYVCRAEGAVADPQSLFNLMIRHSAVLDAFDTSIWISTKLET